MIEQALDAHDALPGVPSPSETQRVFGHAEQERFLCNAWASGRMHHALLFDGPAGIGKASLAFRFARHVISYPHPKLAPDHFDGTGDHLVHPISIGAHSQVLHLTRPLDQKSGKFKTVLTVDETRKISHFLSMTIPGQGWRIVIVDPVNDMNTNAANALLKNLEEPTPRTLFILIAHSAGGLLPTIRSRCLQLRFNPLGEDAMRDTLQALHIGQEGELEALISHSSGSPRIAAMLSGGGALEIIEAAESVLSANRFDSAKALKVGEAMSARDNEPLFLLLAGHLSDRIAGHAASACRNGANNALVLAQFHSAFNEKLAEVRGYNLDKRQFLVSALRNIHQMLAG